MDDEDEDEDDGQQRINKGGALFGFEHMKGKFRRAGQDADRYEEPS